jgi:hypothetical protein
MIPTPDHGTERPVSLAIKCDVPDCPSCWNGPTVLGVHQELTAKQEMRAEAESNGWYVARDRGAVNQNWDLCPGHAPPSEMRAKHVGRMR